jgi:hypothetical protein
MRKPPVSPPDSLTRKPVWDCEAKVELITRLFGGGAKTREVDKVSWLRSSAAKSALRACERERESCSEPPGPSMRKAATKAGREPSKS